MSELNGRFVVQLSPTECEMLGLGQTIMYSYRCAGAIMALRRERRMGCKG
jgi:hypothetical protein